MMKLLIYKGLLNWHSNALRSSNTGKAKNREKIALKMRLALLWTSAAVGLIGLLFGFDLIGEALEECFTLLFEFTQEKLETMYRVGFKLNLYHAQMATAYTGFVVLVGLGFIAFKKLLAAFREVQASWVQERDKVQTQWLRQWDNVTCWWDTLDSFNKYSAIIGLTVIAIPLVSILCLVLGKVVAEIL